MQGKDYLARALKVRETNADPTEAIRLLEQIIEKFPGSESAEAAQAQLYSIRNPEQGGEAKPTTKHTAHGMKRFGLILMVLGLAGGVYAFSMDTSVASGSYSNYVPDRVNNIGLMDDRRNYLYASGLAILIGVILFGFGSVQQKLDPSATDQSL
jgi:hypothetical protein